MDPLTLAAGAGLVAATAGLGSGLRFRRRLRQAEAALASLRRELQAEQYAANHDSLTGLPNRRAFFQLGTIRLADPHRPAIACVVIDLNSTKQINDTLGHAAGDQVLVTVADRLAAFAGDNLVARFGGDEFVGLFTGSHTGWQLGYPAVDDLAEALAAPMSIAGRWIQVTAAVGVAPVRPGAGLTAALHDADSAMYRAKATGVGTACYHPAIDHHTTQLPAVRSATGQSAPLPPATDYRSDSSRPLVNAAPR